MRSPLRILFVLPILLPFAGCDSSGTSSAGLGAACRGGSELCLVSCSLGCSLEGCSVRSIPVNQRLVFRLSQAIDPDSVTPSTVSIRSSQGQQPIGELLVQGSDIVFKPAVLPNNRYGFDENEIYSLVLAGGEAAPASIRSISGDRLGAQLSCTLSTDLGVVDADGKPPIGTLVVPQKTGTVKADSLVVIEFSESINTLPFQNGGTGGTILYKVALPDPSTPNGCSRRFFPLPGTASLSEDAVTGQTRVVFRPSLLLPSEACVQVEITDQIRDLSGKAAASQVFDFTVEKRPVQDQFIEETFSSSGKQDALRSGAKWGNGLLTSGRLGGTGVLGSFRAADGKDLQQKDGQGRDIYEWNLDSAVIPGSRTLDGKDVTVTNGIFEFTDFTVGENEHVRFVGTKPPIIRATGLIKIDGAVTLVSPTATTKPPIDARVGWTGGVGGPGGGRGGQGADEPTFPNGSINGRAGQDVIVPTGHPRSGQAAGTGGPGSKAFPRSGLAKDIVWITLSSFKIFVRQMAQGGTGGSLYDPGDKSLLGTLGVVERAPSGPSPILGPYTNGEFPPPGDPSVAFPVLPVVSSIASRDLFRLGGAGGGGGGTHPAFTPSESSISWSEGGGGGGGGGSIAFEAGGDFVVSQKGEIWARGGDTLNTLNTNGSAPARAPGGGGSGGSVLIQVAGQPTIIGKVDVLGGIGGTFKEASPLIEIKGKAGDGGAGYIRVEADPAPNAGSFGGFAPKARADNVGLLRAIDDVPQSVAASGIYVAQSLFPPTWLYFEIRAKIEGKTVIYSDDQNAYPGSRRPTRSEPIAWFAKSVAADAQTSKPIGDPTDWVPETVKDFGLKKYEEKAGNGVNYLLILDKSKTPSGKGTIEIERIRIYYRG